MKRDGKTLMPISPFTEQGVFEPEATAAMGEAFDAACKELHCATRAEVVRELVATLIIAAASQGELDPVRLRTTALTGFAIGTQKLCDTPVGLVEFRGGRASA